jgi:hypothetical protein
VRFSSRMFVAGGALEADPSLRFGMTCFLLFGLLVKLRRWENQGKQKTCILLFPNLLRVVVRVEARRLGL